MSRPPETPQDEQDYFERRAALWWQADGPFWPLIGLNGLRIPYIIENTCTALGRPTHTHQPLQGLTVLDIGCGGGLASEALAQAGANVTGIDIVEANIRTAQAHAAASGANITYRTSDVHSMLAEGHSYDVVLTLEVVEHVADAAEHLRMAAQMVKPGGILVVATLNRTLRSYLTAILGAEYILRLLPRGTHHWRRFVKPAEVGHVLRTAGMTCTNSTGVKLNPLSKRFSFSHFQVVNYMMCWHKK
ncbi:MAG: bifunctional 2-polyprenyl-6-hydroxyphenol methylase/3-demethylubiquinol 3-O-methyltransferase UbiG [Proteobacteria bacterium]|nr:bifunctional 2-polyprenyl-6-hydroxyphenol methylase/3-demethylubiquinol 3-O-methyltransferase UbiG [Pseudomonadota bacterium]